MKYRSFNEELIICTALIINVFNDIIIDRRSHGLVRDYSKPLSLKQIAQQKIQVPCIVGNRSNIIRSLQNQQGKYKLPIIILQQKDIKTDEQRMCALHDDFFVQQDQTFSQLDPKDPHYKPVQLSKRRGQPVLITYQMTILSKYKEDLDQILGNWAVHFRPDIYVRWWHPRIKTQPLESQILWSHSIGFDSVADYDPTKIFTYKSSTTFTFKSWLFYGMQSKQNQIGPESIIRKIKFFPNRSEGWDEQDIERGYKDQNDYDDTWYLGDLYQTPNEIKGQLGFYGMDSDQQFENYGSDQEGIKAGKYIVNNVFSQNHQLISGDPGLSGVKMNPMIGDVFDLYTQKLIGKTQRYYTYLNMDTINNSSNAFLKVVWFKGNYKKQDMLANPPSGDYFCDYFYKTYTSNDGQKQITGTQLDFGTSKSFGMQQHINYDIGNKDFSLNTTYKCNQFIISGLTIANSQLGAKQSLEISSKFINDKHISFHYLRTFDKDYTLIKDDQNYLNDHQNVKIYKESGQENPLTKFLMESTIQKNNYLKVFKIINQYKEKIDLNEISQNQFELQIKGSKFNKELISNNIQKLDFKTVYLVGQIDKNNIKYQIYVNKYFYMVIKINDQNIQYYDLGINPPLKFLTDTAPLFEIMIPESKMLMGINFDMSIR